VLLRSLQPLGYTPLHLWQDLQYVYATEGLWQQLFRPLLFTWCFLFIYINSMDMGQVISVVKILHHQEKVYCRTSQFCSAWPTIVLFYVDRLYSWEPLSLLLFTMVSMLYCYLANSQNLKWLRQHFMLFNLAWFLNGRLIHYMFVPHYHFSDSSL